MIILTHINYTSVGGAGLAGALSSKNHVLKSACLCSAFLKLSTETLDSHERAERRSLVTCDGRYDHRTFKGD